MFEYNLNDSRFLDAFEDFVKERKVENLIRIAENQHLPKVIVNAATSELKMVLEAK